MQNSPDDDAVIAKFASGSRSVTRQEVALRCLRSEDLFGNGRKLLIEHQGVHYQLQITGQGKLLLTK